MYCSKNSNLTSNCSLQFVCTFSSEFLSYSKTEASMQSFAENSGQKSWQKSLFESLFLFVIGQGNWSNQYI
jgi:hypothetical protein